MSVQRGEDPRELTLVSFGGAGGLHVCSLAEALGMERALIPIHGGVLSALGMLVAPRARQLSRTLNSLLAETGVEAIEAELERLASRGRAALGREGVADGEIGHLPSLDLRYQGQSYTLNLPWQGHLEGVIGDFHRRHRERYGHAMEELPVELVNVRLQLRGPEPQVPLEPPGSPSEGKPRQADLYGIAVPVDVYEREGLAVGREIRGPALITERVSTSYLAEGWCCRVDGSGSLLLWRDDA
jgi:N-methylhydantoinase A